MNNDLDRLMSRVTKTATGCWEWNGRRFRDGYGEFNFGVRRTVAHRAAWELTKGPIPAGLYVCHHCDNPPCVNPEHLFLGTPKENERDKMAKGRDARGTANATLTVAQVHEVRAAAAAGEADRVIAARYGVTAAAVVKVRTGQSWKAVAWRGLRPGPRKRGRAPAPRRTDGLLACGRCKGEKAEGEFPPSVVKRGGGWCRACYAAWEKSRRRVEHP